MFVFKMYLCLCVKSTYISNEYYRTQEHNKARNHDNKRLRFSESWIFVNYARNNGLELDKLKTKQSTKNDLSGDFPLGLPPACLKREIFHSRCIKNHL